MSNTTLKSLKQMGKAQPFGSHFTTRLDGVNSKLICALSRPDANNGTTGCDDAPPPPPPAPVESVDAVDAPVERAEP